MMARELTVVVETDGGKLVLRTNPQSNRLELDTAATSVHAGTLPNVTAREGRLFLSLPAPAGSKFSLTATVIVTGT
jgi:hypothetical protein